eukprot:28668-Hanusia_phi.AAC.1
MPLRTTLPQTFPVSSTHPSDHELTSGKFESSGVGLRPPPGPTRVPGRGQVCGTERVESLAALSAAAAEARQAR